MRLFDIEFTGRPEQDAHFRWFDREFGAPYTLWSHLTGVNKVQPMVIVDAKAASHREPDVEGPRRVSCRLLRPVRYRILAPETYDEGIYYEYRVETGIGDQTAAAQDIAKEHHAMIAFDRSKQSMYFVLRSKSRAVYAFEGLIAHLENANYDILQKHWYRVVADSNPRYDKGW